MSFWKTKEMEQIEKDLRLDCEYREDQGGYPWASVRDTANTSPSILLFKTDWVKLYHEVMRLRELVDRLEKCLQSEDD